MPFWGTLGKIGSAFLPVVGEAIQGSLNAKTARENTDKTISANKQMAEYQYSKDLEMWNRGNVYNSPEAQMERLKKAGLNPNMVYGSGSAGGMSAGQLPKYNAPTQEYNYQPPVDIPSMIGQFQNFRLGNAQIRSTEERSDKTQLESDFLEKTFGWRQLNEYDKHRQMRNQTNLLVPGGLMSRLMNSQVQYKEGAMRTQSLEQQRLIEQTRNLDLQNDYFAAKAITGLFGGAVGAMGKLGSMFSKSARAGKATGALSKGTVKAPKLSTNQLFERAMQWERRFDKP